MNKGVLRLSRKTSIVLLSLFLTVVAISAVIKVYDTHQRNQNPKNSFLEIRGLTSHIFLKPKKVEALNYIKEQLLEVAKMNGLDQDANTEMANDFTVRNNSFNQYFDDASGINTVEFIVDSKMAEQSYDIKYQWPEDGRTVDTESLYGKVSCVKEKDVIYKNFKCQDTPGISGWNQHPLVKKLPYVQSNFRITQHPAEEGMLLIKLNLSSPEKKSKMQDEIRLKYKNEALDWIRQSGFSPNDFWYIYEDEI